MMNITKTFLSICTLILVTACQCPTNYQMLQKTPKQGSAFTIALAGDYNSLASEQANASFFTEKQEYFAKKGLIAAGGEPLAPEVLTAWMLDPRQVPELAQARTMLITLLEEGSHAVAPVESARAQVTYDCWLAGTSLGWKETNVCRAGFYKAVEEVSIKLAKAGPMPLKEILPIEEVGEEDLVMFTPPREGAPEAVLSTPFRVFFPLNSTKLNSTAKAILDYTAKTIKKTQPMGIQLIGHADRTGKHRYNLKLSQKRAQVVKEYLVRKSGYPANKIVVEALGDTDPLVAEQLNSPELLNRRVAIVMILED